MSSVLPLIFIAFLGVISPVFAQEENLDPKKTELIPGPKQVEIFDRELLIKINALIDTPYKLAAHYVPPIFLRALTNSNYPKDIRKAHYERLIFTSCEEKTGQCTGLIEEMKLDITVEKTGFFSRKGLATGTINGLPVNYSNDMQFKPIRIGTQTIRSTLAGMPFINLDIATDGNEKTNNVTGTLLGKQIKYFTKYRTSEGTIDGHRYKIYLEGIHGKGAYSAILDGQIGEYKITGYGNQVSKDYYEIVEHYGPLTIKSTLKVFN